MSGPGYNEPHSESRRFRQEAALKDRRIAELEAENEEWIGYFDACYTDMCHYKDRAEQAEAELAERDNRRCKECVCQGRACEPYRTWGCVHPDFCCNQWTARAEEGSET